MGDVTYINEREGEAIANGGSPTQSNYIHTMEDYLCGCVNIDIPKEVILRILLERDVDIYEDIYNVDRSIRDLCKADLYVWMCMGVSRRNTVADSDNGWSHSDGGYTITNDDKKLFLKMANAIYEENGEKPVGKTVARITSSGIKPCNYNIDGSTLPYILS